MSRGQASQPGRVSVCTSSVRQWDVRPQIIDLVVSRSLPGGAALGGIVDGSDGAKTGTAVGADVTIRLLQHVNSHLISMIPT
jgi:hypothetical protein